MSNIQWELGEPGEPEWGAWEPEWGAWSLSGELHWGGAVRFASPEQMPSLCASSAPECSREPVPIHNRAREPIRSRARLLHG